MRHFERAHRSLTKTITYRVMILISTSIITYIATRDWHKVIEIGGLASIVNTCIYYLHERAWSGVAWGRTRHEKTTRR